MFVLVLAEEGIVRLGLSLIIIVTRLPHLVIQPPYHDKTFAVKCRIVFAYVCRVELVIPPLAVRVLRDDGCPQIWSNRLKQPTLSRIELHILVKLRTLPRHFDIIDEHSWRLYSFHYFIVDII